MKRRLDLQDGLLLLGVCFLCGGVASIYIPAACILFGILCLSAVMMIERAQTKAGKE